MSDNDDDWTDDIEEILTKVRQNCIDMYKYHLCRYFQYKRVLPIFRVPVLILNALNSVFSVGLQPYMQQSLISVLNCMISLIATLINSIEMYMGIQKSMESEMSSSQGFYILSIGIYKTLTLKRENRDINGKQYLMECYNTYSELVRNSKLIKDPYMLQKDFLQNVSGVLPTGNTLSLLSGGVEIGGEAVAELRAMPNEEMGRLLQDMDSIVVSPGTIPTRLSLPPSAPPLHLSSVPLPSQIMSRDLESNRNGSTSSIIMPTFSVIDLPRATAPPPQPPSHQESPYALHRHHGQHHPHPHPHPHHQTPSPPLLQHASYDHSILQPSSLFGGGGGGGSFSRKGIFGGPPKRNAFLEMAGVDLGDSPPEEVGTSSPSDHLVGSIRNLFTGMTTTTSTHPSVTSSPETSHHSHTHSHMASDSDHPLQQPHLPPPPLSRLPSPPQSQTSPPATAPSPFPSSCQTQQLPTPTPSSLQQSKEKGVKDIIQKIESSGHPPSKKTDSSQAPPPAEGNI